MSDRPKGSWWWCRCYESTQMQPAEWRGARWRYFDGGEQTTPFEIGPRLTPPGEPTELDWRAEVERFIDEYAFDPNIKPLDGVEKRRQAVNRLRILLDKTDPAHKEPRP